MAIVRAPIRGMGAQVALQQAAAGNAVAHLLLDTWVIFGLDVGGIGIAALLASRSPPWARRDWSCFAETMQPE